MKLPLTATALVCVGAAGIAVGALVLEPAAPSAAPAPALAPAASTVTPATVPAGYATTVVGTPAPAAPAVAAAGSAEIRGFAFATAPVAPGATVTVTNRDDAGHTFTADAFDTGTIDGGSSATFTAPSAPGSYPIVCLIHPSMTGSLVVG